MAQNAPDLSSVQRIYEESLAEHGATAAGVGWGDEQKQRWRFDRLARVVEPVMGPISVNDLGCGYGGLYQHLRSAGVDIARYRGHDISERMLDEARARLPTEGVTFSTAATLDSPADYSFASGVFNVLPTNVDEDTWTVFVDVTLDSLWEHSSTGFAFNALSTHVDFRSERLYYADPSRFLDRCCRRYSRDLQLLHGYGLFEWTILVHR